MRCWGGGVSVKDFILCDEECGRVVKLCDQKKIELKNANWFFFILYFIFYILNFFKKKKKIFNFIYFFIYFILLIFGSGKSHHKTQRDLRLGIHIRSK